ncbi:phage terminase small subunit [Cohnella herbarum]|uniref:PBSX phage terminase small subunit-like N-terminal domain-containing protein n=1 Tax=Cohnella herbarum TaxID=2728023 RepID=A0A7Z2ZPV9_9BACL|nr:phage terminase small subunit [Cohnella herbarum]QJD87891.1 hypothetical protein HH215_35005 [Cohnella herbarum]
MRPRSDKREKAFMMWHNSGRKMKFVEIAKRLGISPSQVRKWKHEDVWKTKQPRKRGGQPGNVNASGNNGGGAPPGNKNNWKHGGYESMWMSQIAVDHKLKLMKTETDPRKILVNEIFLLEYREFKLMGYIKQIEEGWDASSTQSKKERFQKIVDDIGDVPTFDEEGNLQTERKVEYEMIEVEIVTKTPQMLERLLSIENALSTVQGRKLKCIALLDQFDRNELTVEELKLKVERMRLEVKNLKEAAW